MINGFDDIFYIFYFCVRIFCDLFTLQGILYVTDHVDYMLFS